MPITSKDAMAYTALLDAVGDAVTSNSNAPGFLRSLHDSGFQVVAIPPPEPEPAAEPIVAAPPADGTSWKIQPMRWREWSEDLMRLNSGIRINGDDARNYSNGMTPDEAFAAKIPF